MAKFSENRHISYVINMSCKVVGLNQILLDCVRPEKMRVVASQITEIRSITSLFITCDQVNHPIKHYGSR